MLFSHLVRDGYSNLISADNLEYTVHSFVLIYEPHHSYIVGQILYLLFGSFPVPPGVLHGNQGQDSTNDGVAGAGANGKKRSSWSSRDQCR